jgi:hypothetical protein
LPAFGWTQRTAISQEINIVIPYPQVICADGSGDFQDAARLQLDMIR